MERTYNERRFLAFVVDISIALVIAVTLTTVYNVKLPLPAPKFINRLVYLTDAIFFVYCFVCYLLFGGLTIGRMLFNLRIVCKDGRRIGFMRSLCRSLFQCILPIAILNIFYMLYFRTKESFFDKSTDTKNIYWHKTVL